MTIPQEALFDTAALAPTTVDEPGIHYAPISAKKVTFKAGLASRVHRWFRLTPSFGPDLVRHMLSELKCAPGEVVLDPFAGASTTLIECQLEQRRCIGFEINPLLHFAGLSCLHWAIDPNTARAALDEVSARAMELRSRVTFELLEEHGLAIPPIHNPTRWWRPDVLRDLLVLKASISDVEDAALRDFLRLGLAGKLVPDFTNVTLGRLQLFFIDRTTDAIDVFGGFASHIRDMILDLEEIHEQELQETAALYLHDSTTSASELDVDGQVGCVTTSPPYPNRYSYVWNTRPHLYFFDFFDSARQASDLDKATIGGTWGTATSVLAKGVVEPTCDAVDTVVSQVVRDIRSSDNLMANYVMKYFNLLADQIVTMDPLLASNGRVAYVVGCSRIKGTFVETDVLLGKLFERLNLGYARHEVHRIRKRNSGKDLHESIVYAWKG
jgi:DNA methylase